MAWAKTNYRLNRRLELILIFEVGGFLQAEEQLEALLSVLCAP